MHGVNVSNGNEIILAVNPGSTSTKMALFEGENHRTSDVVRHDARALESHPTIWSQFEFRTHAVREWARAQTEHLSAVVAIGGLLRPVPGGTYRVNERMLEDARGNLQGEHASNIGCAMASVLAREYNCPAFVVDPVSVDEFECLAKYSGHPLIQRKSLSHALNIHAAAMRAAKDLGSPLATTAFVVAHLGGGISIAPVCAGRIIDVNDASSDGPFSPERTGGLPLQEFITLCFSGAYKEHEVRSLVMGRGGLMAYLGTNSAQEVQDRIGSGDEKAREVFEAMAYQIAKEIGAMATVLKGNVTAIVLAGGLAASNVLVHWIEERVRRIAPVLVYPGEDEMQALAFGALRVLRNEEQPLEY
jgi:butyrate kinase